MSITKLSPVARLALEFPDRPTTGQVLEVLTRAYLAGVDARHEQHERALRLALLKLPTSCVAAATVREALGITLEPAL
jgi:hypothetical protein